MKYLITTSDGENPFLTDFFNIENFNMETGMIVYNLNSGLFTNNGTHWEVIEKDEL